MKYAVIKLANRQYTVKEGDTIKVDKMEKAKPEVLLFSDGKSIEVGAPTIADIEIKTDVVEQTFAKKIRVARFKSKSRYSKARGHKQPLTVLAIKSIGKKAKKADAPAASEKKVTKKGTATKKADKK